MDIILGREETIAHQLAFVSWDPAWNPGNPSKLRLLRFAESLQIGLTPHSPQTSESYLEGLTDAICGLSHCRLRSLRWGTRGLTAPGLRAREAGVLARLIREPDSALENITVVERLNEGAMHLICRELQANTRLKHISFYPPRKEKDLEQCFKVLYQVALKDHNLVLEDFCIFGATKSVQHRGACHRKAQFCLRLNQQRLRQLVANTNTTTNEWYEALLRNHTDESIVFFLLQHNPSLVPH